MPNDGNHRDVYTWAHRYSAEATAMVVGAIIDDIAQREHCTRSRAIELFAKEVSRSSRQIFRDLSPGHDPPPGRSVRLAKAPPALEDIIPASNWPAPPPPLNGAVRFDEHTGKLDVKLAQQRLWQMIWPQLSIANELAKAEQHLRDHPDKRPSQHGVYAFCVRWLNAAHGRLLVVVASALSACVMSVTMSEPLSVAMSASCALASAPLHAVIEKIHEAKRSRYFPNDPGYLQIPRRSKKLA